MTPPISQNAPLILASGSRYRAELLRRLAVPFEAIASDADETPAAGESPADLAQRLARAKAEHLVRRFPDRWILGSDQVCACDGRLLGKPGTAERAREQLRALSGREAQFLTAVCLLDHGAATAWLHLDTTVVRFRGLGDAEIQRYVQREPALDCAGSFKAEGLGVSLCAAIESSDPTGLIGLPLIATTRLLAQAGYALP